MCLGKIWYKKQQALNRCYGIMTRAFTLLVKLWGKTKSNKHILYKQPKPSIAYSTIMISTFHFCLLYSSCLFIDWKFYFYHFYKLGFVVIVCAYRCWERTCIILFISLNLQMKWTITDNVYAYHWPALKLKSGLSTWRVMPLTVGDSSLTSVTTAFAMTGCRVLVAVIFRCFPAFAFSLSVLTLVSTSGGAFDMDLKENIL